MSNEEILLSPGDAARMLGVHPSTLSRWAKQGKIRCVVLPSGHRKYPLSEILRIKGARGRVKTELLRSKMEGEK